MTGKEILEAQQRKPSDGERSELTKAMQELGEKLIKRRLAEYQRLNFGKLD